MSNKALYNFLKQQVAEQNVCSTGSELIDRVYQIPLKSCTLIRTEPYSGGTAFLLQLTAQLTQEHTVVYADVGDALLSHRLWGVNLDNLQIIKPTEGLEIIEVAKTLSLRNIKPVYILDNFSFIQDNYNLKNKIGTLARTLKDIDPECTIIATQRKGNVDSVWSSVVDLKHSKNIYDNSGENNLLGHLAIVETLKGKAEVYIEHVTGRISKGFETATILVEKGNSKGGVFESDGIRARGFFNFIKEYDNAAKSN